MDIISKNIYPVRGREGSQRVFISNGIKETKQIAKDFLKVISVNKNGATMVCLYGDLGTGKTTFSQFIGKELGIKRKINSPTFVIMKKYNLRTSPQPSPDKGEGRNLKYFVHIDAYRLKNEKELEVLGWSELISNKENLIFIEWPEKIIKAIPKKHHKIHISHLPAGRHGTKEGHRKFKIKKA